MNVLGKRFLVVGLARSGLAAARFLHRRKAQVTVNDRAEEAKLGKWIARLPEGVRVVSGGHPEHLFLQADCIVLSPGVPASLEPLQSARRAGIPVIAEVELAFRFLRGRVVGVTGSNGKTTTVSLLGEILKSAGFEAAVAGNIGDPLTAAVDEPGESGRRIYVVELSSFQLEAIERLRCHIAVLLNITADHLDRYPGLDEYQAAKERIFLNQAPDDFAVLNADDELARQAAKRVRSRVVRFSRQRELPEGACLDRNGSIVFRWQGRESALVEPSELALRGAHNLENALAAVAAAGLLGAGMESLSDALRSFPGVEHRLEPCGESGGVEFFNDSKATNVDSALKALQAFQERPVVAIFGGLDKGGDFSLLRPHLKQVRRALLIGQAAGKIEQALRAAAPTERCGDLDAAVERAFSLARPGDAVLLAPACASFDQFDDYEQRGRRFKELVRRRINDSAHTSAAGGRP